VSRSRFAVAALIYAMVIGYASTVVGVQGLNFVPLDPGDALQRLIHIPYVENGSDQRSDWMGNLVMLVPLGFLVAGSLSRQTRAFPPTAIGAFFLCLLYIFVVKYTQLFFPPRTVTLNYVIAQSAGAAFGVLLFGIIRKPFADLRRDMNPLESLRLILRIYTGILIAFLLAPLDFALSIDDVIAQLMKLPDSFTAISGAGRPMVVRIAVIVGGIVAMMPVGALLMIVSRGRLFVGRTTADAAWIGFCAMAGVYALSALLLSGSPSLPSVGFRTVGIALGAWSMRWLTRQDSNQLRHDLSRLVPWSIPIYLVTLAAVNGLLSLDWITPGQGASAFYIYGAIPLYDYYIVTKSEAAKNIAAHAVMYAPIGVMIWLRARDGGSKAAAFFVAAILSAIVETGRFLRPGLVPDINAVPLAGAAAWAALALMPMLWQLLSAVAIGGRATVALQMADGMHPVSAIDWRSREAERPAGRRDQGKAIGDIEEY
jgi:VanZ family protein